MIEIGHITKRYGKLVALDNVSFDVRDNECFALLGLNGAGKTTLINILSTSLLPTAGTVTINGLDVIKDRDGVRKIVNISPQESAVAKNLTVRENIDFMASLYGIENKREKIDGIIEKFALREKENVRCKKLSGGQLRRVSIALAMITEPQVLFLDEPTLGLDVKSRKILWDIISELKSNRTIILTTHYLEEVEFLADRIGVISRGHMKAIGTRDEILKMTETDTLENAFLNLAEEEL
ncbi:MAG: ATP-binding cassette domain-containing protein [Clostridiales bacterium]|nr:ATP-binding cassette domain-containing protein [Clostridiales bacterium]